MTPRPKPSRCRSCNQPVRWVRTVHNRAHPLDAEPTPDGQWVITATPAGTEIMVLAAHPDEQRPRYTSHFVTCPDADDWRSR